MLDQKDINAQAGVPEIPSSAQSLLTSSLLSLLSLLNLLCLPPHD